MADAIDEGDDEAVLVTAVQGGDAEAFTELYRRHHPAVRRACRRLLRDAVEAEEVAQAVFVRALDRIEQCRGERRFGPWVQVIAQRRVRHDVNDFTGNVQFVHDNLLELIAMNNDLIRAAIAKIRDQLRGVA